MECPFCNPDPVRMRLSNDHGIALRDGFPISPGHTLVIPKLHVLCLFDLPEDTQQSLWALVAVVRSKLSEEFHPDGFNIGLNDGEAAGQTIMHAHIHVIPRFQGDVPDPKGGIRWIIPTKARYWK